MSLGSEAHHPGEKTEVRKCVPHHSSSPSAARALTPQSSETSAAALSPEVVTPRSRDSGTSGGCGGCSKTEEGVVLASSIQNPAPANKLKHLEHSQGNGSQQPCSDCCSC